MNDWVKDNIIAVLSVVLVVGGFLLTQYIKAEISDQMDTRGLPSSEKITTMEGDIQDNEDDIKTIEDRWNRLVDALAADDD